MTNKEAVKEYKNNLGEETYKNLLKHDKIALRTGFNDYKDALCKDGEITQKQYDTWCCPSSWN